MMIRVVRANRLVWALGRTSAFLISIWAARSFAVIWNSPFARISSVTTSRLQGVDSAASNRVHLGCIFRVVPVDKEANKAGERTRGCRTQPGCALEERVRLFSSQVMAHRIRAGHVWYTYHL